MNARNLIDNLHWETKKKKHWWHHSIVAWQARSWFLWRLCKHLDWKIKAGKVHVAFPFGLVARNLVVCFWNEKTNWIVHVNGHFSSLSQPPLSIHDVCISKQIRSLETVTTNAKSLTACSQEGEDVPVVEASFCLRVCAMFFLGGGWTTGLSGNHVLSFAPWTWCCTAKSESESLLI